MIAAPSLEDEQLLEKFRQPASRNYAFNLLVRKYQERVYFLIRKMVIDHDDTDDLVQETFIKVWNYLDTFQGEAQLFTWIYRIATNECLRFLKKKRRRLFVPATEVTRELSKKIDESVHLDGDEVQRTLQKALLTLPDKQRLVFNLKYFEEMTYETMAEITGTSVGALKASYHLAVKKIEAYVHKQTQ